MSSTTTTITALYVDQREAARRLGLSTHCLELWRSIKKGPPFCRFGRAVRYDLRDLDAWALAQKVGA